MILKEEISQIYFNYILQIRRYKYSTHTNIVSSIHHCSQKKTTSSQSDKEDQTKFGLFTRELQPQNVFDR